MQAAGRVDGVPRTSGNSHGAKYFQEQARAGEWPRGCTGPPPVDARRSCRAVPSRSEDRSESPRERQVAQVDKPLPKLPVRERHRGEPGAVVSLPTNGGCPAGSVGSHDGEPMTFEVAGHQQPVPRRGEFAKERDRVDPISRGPEIHTPL